MLRGWCWEQNKPKDNILEDILMIWMPLVGEYLQFMKEPTNEVDKNAVTVVRTNCDCKEEVVVPAYQKCP